MFIAKDNQNAGRCLLLYQKLPMLSIIVHFKQTIDQKSRQHTDDFFIFRGIRFK